jgi:sigma-B regulation protein RsbU (phosphoserine phosphatase)
MPVARWEEPGASHFMPVGVASRPSAVLRALFSERTSTRGVWVWFFLIIAVLFLIFEIIALVIGVSLTRTITGAVHGLYEGTGRVMRGDFSHRIEVRGNDQLADLGHSFNRMTENLERLLRVEKEQERLHAELEIAREVQSQLYPKVVPTVPGLEITARCTPARSVSGDYYDYIGIDGAKVALAIGDVAGKGISAALLMATVQSSLRTQLRGLAGAAPVASQLVGRLNQQLYADTSPEKFATFYFGLYDAGSGSLHYTNAGHPPPIIVRDGGAMRLETNGIVVGAFPFAEYGESRIDLKPGDLIVCFTDGITEPENEYGEMFGEDRLVELAVKHSAESLSVIMDTVYAAVGQWSSSVDGQDDMTMLVARRT